MTIKELYNWASEHDCLDYDIYKCINLDMYPINDCYIFGPGKIAGKSLTELCSIKPLVIVD